MGNAEGESNKEKDTTNQALEIFKKFFEQDVGPDVGTDGQIDSKSGQTMLARSTYLKTIGGEEIPGEVVGIIFYSFYIRTGENLVTSTNIVVGGKEGLILEDSDVDIRKIDPQIYLNTENGMVLSLTLQRTEGGEIEVILKLQSADTYEEQEV